MDANERLHRDWLGMAQPEGLVVTASVLKEAEANITWPVTELQVALRELSIDGRVLDLRALFRDILEWSDELVVDRSSMPASLSVTVEEGDRLVPTYALRSADDESRFAFLVTEAIEGTDLDAAYDERRWTASAHQRFERLLRETGLGVGLLTNGRDFRLVHAPRGESAGWVTFRVADMLTVDGRPLLGAFHMLLNERRLLTLAEDKRLLALLQKSRAYQSVVSTALREQVLSALRTLLQGVQAADHLAEGRLLAPYRGEAMAEVYLGLVTVLMRMIFVLFAEERELLPMSHPLYAESYSLTRLYAQLVRDRGEHGEGLDARYGAWARVLTLFRVLHDGLRAADGLSLPAREGKLFNPDTFPLLEGRPRGSSRQKGERLAVPRIPDGVVYRVLDQLLVLDGERLQYKGLDVEQIGSVYEGLMGFEIEVAEGDSLCLSPEHVVVDLEKLLKLPGAERIKQLKAEANLDVKDKAANEVKAATTVQALHGALGRRVSQRQPGILPKGTLYLQPGEERRRSGSHYTPRSLTQPIVETTLRPVLERLRSENLTPPLVAYRDDASPLPIDGEGGQGGEVSGPLPGVTGRAHVAPEKLARARQFRKQPTDAEARAWELLRDRRCLGLKFRRQQVIEGLIVDFYCAEHRVAVELDGPIHDERREYDEARDAILAGAGIRVLRLPNAELSADSLTALLSPFLSPPLPIDGEGGQGGEVSAPPTGHLTPDQILSLKVCDPAMGSGAFLVETCRQLSEHLVTAWRRTGTMPELPPDEDPLLHARRLVAQRCLYGVDKNPLAVDLARLSMWLVTFAREHPFTFVDHALRSGDSLVGLSREQIVDLTPYPPEAEGEKKPARGKKAAAEPSRQLDLVRPLVARAVAEAWEHRKKIHAIGDPPDNAELRRLWQDANDALDKARMLGDCVVAAYFGEDSDKARKTALSNLRLKVQDWLSNPPPSARQGEGGRGGEVELRGMADGLREGDRPLEPFHWEIEFPEVFGRENPGFDCFVGNPPFLGGKRISTNFGESYSELLAASHEGASTNADLVGFFFRASYLRLRQGGALGLIATNTIAQGDTRQTSLGWIRRHGGTIFAAERRLRWPGVAAVVVSVVHVYRGAMASMVAALDRRPVGRITSFLFHAGGDDEPSRLVLNDGRSFVGTYILGMGFTFADGDPEATAIEEMHRLVGADPGNASVIQPFIGGAELNSSPTQSPDRYVINFGERTEGEAARWPELLGIVREKVRPARQHLKREVYRNRWWQFGEKQLGLYAAIAPLSRALVNCQVSAHLSLAFQPKGRIFAHTTNVFALEGFCSFATMQSRSHEVWARFFGSSMKDDLRYTPTDCFETFPFPPCLYPLGSPPPSPQLDALEAIGKEYYEFRASLMADEAVRAKLMNGEPPEGLTKTYNKFHDPECNLPGIVKLRELHAKMDRAVLDAYGWQDIVPEYDFREQLDESIRLTWAEETRDEVLARLLELNRVMAEEENLTPPAPLSLKGRGGRGRGKKDEVGGDDGKSPPSARQGEGGRGDEVSEPELPQLPGKGKGGRKKVPEPEGQGGLFS